MSFISKFDLMSVTPHLYINGKSGYKNAFGGSLTLILISFTLGFFIFFYYNLLQRNEPVIAMYNDRNTNSSYLLNTSETFLGFKLHDRFGDPFDESIYSVHAQYWQYYQEVKNGKIELSYNFTDLKVMKCSNFKVNGNNYDLLYNTTETSDLYCLEPNQIVNIARPFGDPIAFSYINIYFTYCSDEKNKTKKCKSKNELDKILSSYYFGVRFLSYYNNHQNFENPFREMISNIVELSSASFFKRIYAYIKNSNYRSDSGLLLNDYDYYQKTMLESSKTIIDFRDSIFKGGKLLMQFTFTFNENGIEENYVRTYKKIKNILAEVGGLIQFVKMIFSLFIYLYTEINFTGNILNNKIILHFNENKDNGVFNTKKAFNIFKEENNKKSSNILKQKTKLNFHQYNERGITSQNILSSSNQMIKISQVNEIAENKITNKNMKSTFNILSNNKSFDSRKENSTLTRVTLPKGFGKLSDYLCKNRKLSLNKQTKDVLFNYYLCIHNLIRMRNEINLLKFKTFTDDTTIRLFKIGEKTFKIPINKHINNENNNELSLIDPNFNIETEENKKILNEFFLNIY